MRIEGLAGGAQPACHALGVARIASGATRGQGGALPGRVPARLLRKPRGAVAAPAVPAPAPEYLDTQQADHSRIRSLPCSIRHPTKSLAIESVQQQPPVNGSHDNPLIENGKGGGNGWHAVGCEPFVVDQPAVQRVNHAEPSVVQGENDVPSVCRRNHGRDVCVHLALPDGAASGERIELDAHLDRLRIWIVDAVRSHDAVPWTKGEQQVGQVVSSRRS